MNKSVIVYGPQGCGKSLNAELLRDHYGLEKVVELDEYLPHVIVGVRPTPVKLPLVGVLFLTHLTRGQMVEHNIIDADARRVFSYEEAMLAVERGAQDLGGNTLANAGNTLVRACHDASVAAGWWNANMTCTSGDTALRHVQQNTRIGKALVAEKLCLIHSEISEGMEGHRKGLMDDKLPHRHMLEVELADAVIRIADLAGALGYDLGGAIAEKMAFNAVRPDHKKEAREAAGGKAY